MYIKASTSRGRGLLSSADRNEGRELWNVYDHFSHAKITAMDWCREKCYVNGGHNFRIISHSSFSFSVAWECEVEYTDPKTGEVTREPATMIETSQNSYIILLDR